MYHLKLHCVLNIGTVAVIQDYLVTGGNALVHLACLVIQKSQLISPLL